jgi:hypothetical protein
MDLIMMLGHPTSLDSCSLSYPGRQLHRGLSTVETARCCGAPESTDVNAQEALLREESQEIRDHCDRPWDATSARKRA